MRPAFTPSRALSPFMRASGPAVRFHPVLHLVDGDLRGMAAEEPFDFEERIVFGPHGVQRGADSPAAWLAARLRRIASGAVAGELSPRPILIDAPMAALADPDTALACDNAVRGTCLCQQEFCLVFPDAAFAGEAADAERRVVFLRKRGFRVGIDMRQSWHVHLNGALRLMIDTLRVDAGDVLADDTLAHRCEAAMAAGILVVADNARWQDAEALAERGVTTAAAPASDA